VAIVCINYDDQKQIELNVSVPKKRKGLQCACDGEFLMPRFYFNLASKDAAIPETVEKSLIP
jgi:hypothetical protein